DEAVADGASPAGPGSGGPQRSRSAHAGHADAGADGAARRRARPRVRAAVPDVHDPAPRRCACDGRRAVRESGCSAGFGHLPLCDGRRRRPAGRDRPDAVSARCAFRQSRERNTMTQRPTRSTLRAAAAAALFATAFAAAPAFAQEQDILASTDDPRAGLAAGPKNTAEQAALNMRLVAFAPKPAALDSARGLTFINSDLAFRGNYVYQG